VGLSVVLIDGAGVGASVAFASGEEVGSPVVFASGACVGSLTNGGGVDSSIGLSVGVSVVFSSDGLAMTIENVVGEILFCVDCDIREKVGGWVNLATDIGASVVTVGLVVTVIEDGDKVCSETVVCCNGGFDMSWIIVGVDVTTEDFSTTKGIIVGFDILPS